MASTAVAADVQDDEAWLYGETPEKKEGGETSEEPPVPGEAAAVSTLSAAATPFEPGEKKMEDKEAGELSGEEAESKTENANEEEDDDDDDDDSDDDVQVTIGDIKTQTAYDTPMFKSGYGRAGAGSAAPKPQTKGIDLDAPGNINGVSVYEFDISSLKDDERPWRKPGADITDYFNYGFNEETWAKYGEKQRRLRMENCNKPYTGPSKSSQPRSENTTETTDSTIPSPGGGAAGRRAGPPPGRKMAGTIDVIGGSTADSRRPQQDFRDHLTSSEAQDYKKYPPPGMPGPIPTHLPPPDYAVPPPGTMPPPPNPLPPPMVPPPPQGIAPPGLSGPPPNFPVPPNFYPPGPGAPPMSRVGPPPYGDRPPYSFDNFGPPPTFRAPPGPPPNWDSRPDNFNRSWEFPPGQRTSPRSDSDFTSSEEETEVQNKYPSRRGGRENRDGRDGRDIRSSRDARSSRDGHDGREIRDGRDVRDIREIREGRERYDPFERPYQSRRERSVSHDRDRDREIRDREPRDREPREPRDREPRDREPRDREPRDREPREPRESREPRDRELRDRTPRRHVKEIEHDDRRDDRHRSRRRHHDADDHHSKHKKSKRTKHDSDPPTEAPPVAQIETTAAS